MTPGQVFLLVLILLYLSDCFVLVPRRGFAFLSIFRRSRWQVKLPSEALGNDRAGLVMTMPLPPLGRAFVSGLWPISLTPKGFTGVVTSCVNPGPRHPQWSRFIRWEDLKQVGWEGRYLLTNGKRFLKLPSPQIAQEYSKLLLNLAKMPAAERVGAIAKWCRRELSAKRLRRRVRVFERATTDLRHSCNLLFLILFALVPAAYWYFGAHLQFFVILGAAALLMVMIGIEFLCIHRKLYPDHREERLQLWMLVGFMPQYSIRAVDELSKGFLETAHPLAFAEAFLDDSHFRTFRDAILRDLSNPVPHHSPDNEFGEALHAAQSFRENSERPAVQEIAQNRLEDSTHQLPESADLDEESKVFCPRCLMPYQETAKICEDCGGVKTLPLQNG